jgi:hypothetical protein
MFKPDKPIKQYVSSITVNSDLIKPSDTKQYFQCYIKELLFHFNTYAHKEQST